MLEPLGYSDYQSASAVGDIPRDLTSLSVEGELRSGVLQELSDPTGQSISASSSISSNSSSRGFLHTTDSLNPTRSSTHSDDYLLTDIVTGQQVQVNLSSFAFDTYLQLVNANTGEVVSFDDNSGFGTNSQLTFTAEEGVDYIVRATSFRSGATGNYNITTTTSNGSSEAVLAESAVVAEPDDTISQAIDSGLSSNSPSTSFTSTIGDNPNVAPGQDVDFMEVQLNAGDQLTIDIDADEVGSSLDSVLRVFDASGNELTFSDDTPAPGEALSYDSYIEFIASTSNTYYVAVSGYNNSSYDPFVEGSGTRGRTGDYTIELSVTPAPENGFSSIYGYGLVDAAAAVASALGENIPFPDVPDLEGDNWGLDAINAPEVWDQGYTGEGIVVAVVDDGVDYTHPDLNDNIWVNNGEIADNGIDDDGNGYIDDIRGWDFGDEDNDPMPTDEHGTHVAGIIAAENNGFGVTGVAYDAQIMAVKVFDDVNNAATVDDAAAGIIYAADNGADVINLSLGTGLLPTPDLASAIEYATAQGAVVVMAAGNENTTTGFPARYGTEWGIAVGSVDSTNTVASFSNKAGITPLDYVVAPGVDILSTTLDGTYQYFSGTSMASPHVAGVAALILSANPELTPGEVESIIINTANPEGIIV